MADLELVFNEESGVWEERPEPYITVEIETEEDFEYLNAAVEFYKNRDKYEEVVRCEKCKYYDEEGEFCKLWHGVRHPEHFCGEGETEDNEV